MVTKIAKRDQKATEARKQFFEQVAADYLNPGIFKRYYNKRLQQIIKFNVPEGASVLELGCGPGDLLASLEPSRGVGIDFCETVVEHARSRHPDLTFLVADAQGFELDE
jgi:ubiquinone/menaquinone biosynthesis C-methylase UbiE